MKIMTLAGAALLAVASSASAQSLSLTYGSEKCKAGAGGSCHAVATPQPISFFLHGGQTIEDIIPLNENLVIEKGMTVPPFTMIRLG